MSENQPPSVYEYIDAAACEARWVHESALDVPDPEERFVLTVTCPGGTLVLTGDPEAVADLLAVAYSEVTRPRDTESSASRQHFIDTGQYLPADRGVRDVAAQSARALEPAPTAVVPEPEDDFYDPANQGA